MSVDKRNEEVFGQDFEGAPDKNDALAEQFQRGPSKLFSASKRRKIAKYFRRVPVRRIGCLMLLFHSGLRLLQSLARGRFLDISALVGLAPRPNALCYVKLLETTLLHGATRNMEWQRSR